jgi:hypothetical protein
MNFEFPKPTKEHQWLHRLVGQWTMEADCVMGPDQPPSKHTGIERVRSLGGFWTIGEGEGEMPGGGTSQSIMTLGYDPAKKQFVGSFIASMMTHLWIYDGGSLDPAGKVLTLNAEGPNFSGGPNMAKYQDIIEFVNDDHRTLTSRLLGEDGKWTQFMTANYHRKK